MLNSQNLLSMFRNHERLRNSTLSSGIMSIELLKQLQSTPIYSKNSPAINACIQDLSFSNQKFQSVADSHIPQLKTNQFKYFTQPRSFKFAQIIDSKQQTLDFNSDNDQFLRVHTFKNVRSASRPQGKKLDETSQKLVKQVQLGSLSRVPEIRKKLIHSHEKNRKPRSGSTEKHKHISHKGFKIIDKAQQVSTFQLLEISNIQKSRKRQNCISQRAISLNSNRAKSKEKIKQRLNEPTQEINQNKKRVTVKNQNNALKERKLGNCSFKKQKGCNKINKKAQAIHKPEADSIGMDGLANLKQSPLKDTKMHAQNIDNCKSIQFNGISQLQNKQKNLNDIFNKLQNIITQIQGQSQKKQQKPNLSIAGACPNTRQSRTNKMNFCISNVLDIQIPGKRDYGFEQFNLYDMKQQNRQLVRLKQQAIDQIRFFKQTDCEKQQNTRSIQLPVYKSNQQQQVTPYLSRRLIINSSPSDCLKSYNSQFQSQSKITDSRSSSAKHRRFMRVTINEKCKDIQEFNHQQTIQAVQSKNLSIAATKRGQITLKPSKLNKKHINKSQNAQSSTESRFKAGIKVLSSSRSKQQIQLRGISSNNLSKDRIQIPCQISNKNDKSSKRKMLITKAQGFSIRHIKQYREQLKQKQTNNGLTPSRKPQLEISIKLEENAQNSGHIQDRNSMIIGVNNVGKRQFNQENAVHSQELFKYPSQVISKSIKVNAYKSSQNTNFNPKNKVNNYNGKTLNPTIFYQEKRVLKRI